jgi:hypothetical protein
MDDGAGRGVHDGEEVGRIDTCSFVQAGEVEELLRRGLERLRRRCMKRRRSVFGMITHRDLLYRTID